MSTTTENKPISFEVDIKSNTKDMDAVTPVKERLEKEAATEKPCHTFEEINEKLERAEQNRLKAAAEEKERLKNKLERVEQVKEKEAAQTEEEKQKGLQNLSQKLDQANQKRTEKIEDVKTKTHEHNQRVESVRTEMEETRV